VTAVLLALEAACRSAFVPAPPVPPVLHEGHAASALSGDGFDLLVWNVQKGQRPAYPAELEALARDKELVLLQEAYLAPRMLEPLDTRPELQWQVAPSFAYAWRDGSPATGVAIGSAARALDRHAFLSTDTEPLSATPKAALVATYALEGRAEPLLVVCVHAINFRPAQALAAQLRALAPVLREHRGPVLLAGDLNTHRRARMEVLEQFAADHGLRSAFPNWQAAPRDRRPVKDARTHYGQWPLDHVYVRDLVVEDARIVGDARGSDHKPLVLRVSLPSPGATRDAGAD